MPGTEKIHHRDHRGRRDVSNRLATEVRAVAVCRTALADHTKASEGSLGVAKWDWVSQSELVSVSAEGAWLVGAQDFHGIQGSGPARGNIRCAERAKP
jgi:hypothetical protein